MLDAAGAAAAQLLTTLLLSQGVPMLLHGDEMGRTQSGNNNVYAQDSAISWMDWSLLTKNEGSSGSPRGSRTAGRASGVPQAPVLRG